MASVTTPDRGELSWPAVGGPAFQFATIAVANFVIMTFVWMALSLGYASPRALPNGFFLPELAIVMLGAALASLNYSVAFRNVVDPFAPPRPVSAPVSLAIEIRDLVAQPLLWVLALLNVSAIVFLVGHTGGGIESPFAPLLAAPATYGITRTRRGVLELLIVLAAITVFSARAAGEHVHPAPAWWLFPAVAILLLTIAAFVDQAKSGFSAAEARRTSS